MTAMAQAPLPPGIVMSLELPARARIREVVPLIIRVVNTSSTPVQLYFTGREITVDLLILDDQGLSLRKLDGQPLQAILRLETLGAGDTLTVRDAWHFERAGRYSVTAMLLGEAAPYIAPARVIEVH